MSHIITRYGKSTQGNGKWYEHDKYVHGVHGHCYRLHEKLKAYLDIVKVSMELLCNVMGPFTISWGNFYLVIWYMYYVQGDLYNVLKDIYPVHIYLYHFPCPWTILQCLGRLILYHVSSYIYKDIMFMHHISVYDSPFKYNRNLTHLYTIWLMPSVMNKQVCRSDSSDEN
jgi:hypothetical protein